MDSPEYCSTCNSGGAWSGTHQHCSPLNCGYPPKLENGDQKLLNSSTVLFSMVAYRCGDSYIFNTTSEKSIRFVRSILKCSLVPNPHNISDIHFLSQCLEDGSWTPVDVSCVFDSSSLVFSDWPAITISILCIVIIILAVIICWARGYASCQPHTKPSFISKGVNASTIAHSVIDTDLIKSAMTSTKYKPPLSTFHRCIVGYEFELNLKRIVFSSGSVVGIRYPKENISGQRPPYPEPEEENSKSAAAITENQLDASGRSSSERSSGDGEESLYATIRYLSAGKMQM